MASFHWVANGTPKIQRGKSIVVVSDGDYLPEAAGWKDPEMWERHGSIRKVPGPPPAMPGGAGCIVHDLHDGKCSKCDFVEASPTAASPVAPRSTPPEPEPAAAMAAAIDQESHSHTIDLQPAEGMPESFEPRALELVPGPDDPKPEPEPEPAPDAEPVDEPELTEPEPIPEPEPEPETDPADEDLYSVVLIGPPEEPIPVVRELRAATDLSLREAKDLVEGRTIVDGVATVRIDLTAAEAGVLGERLVKAGAHAEVRLLPPPLNLPEAVAAEKKIYTKTELGRMLKGDLQKLAAELDIIPGEATKAELAALIMEAQEE